MQPVRTYQNPSIPAKTRAHRIKPIAAAVALFRLMRDPQDTSQVFRLTEALRGKSTRIMFQRFAASPMGAKILAERRSLLAALTNREALAALPSGSLGRCYLDFMAEENLTAEGLVELAAQNLKAMPSADEGLRLYASRMRDMHDLYHVLTGYGRDELGEVCVLAFSYPQQKIRSFKVISTLGTLNIWRRLRASGVNAKGVGAAFREAARNGRNAAWLPGEDLEAMLPVDVQLLRKRLKIPAPVMYTQIIARLRCDTGTVSGPLQLG
jgi:ubiquinone biosynthesis protein COQ4